MSDAPPPPPPPPGWQPRPPGWQPPPPQQPGTHNPPPQQGAYDPTRAQPTPQYRQYPDQRLYEQVTQPIEPRKKPPKWVWWVGGFVALVIVGAFIPNADEEPGSGEATAAGESDEAVESEEIDDSPTETTEAEPPTTRPPTTQRTTTTRPTTTMDLNTEVALAICDTITEFLDENPDARVIDVIRFGTDWREALTNNGFDPSDIGQKVVSTCQNGYNNEVVLAYGGFGPLVDALDYTLDRGTCGPRGDYGGVLTMSGAADGKYSVELELKYVANGVVEHQTSEYVDVEPGGDGVAFEFFLPSVPVGGDCEVSLVSVRPA